MAYDEDDSRSIFTDTATLIDAEAPPPVPQRRSSGVQNVRAWQSGTHGGGLEAPTTTAHSVSPHASTSRLADDAASLGGRSSTSTLRPLPASRHRSAPPTDYAAQDARRWSDARFGDYLDDYEGYAAQPAGQRRPSETTTTAPDQDALTVPWWSAMLPNPNLRSRTGGGSSPIAGGAYILNNRRRSSFGIASSPPNSDSEPQRRRGSASLAATAPPQHRAQPQGTLMTSTPPPPPQARQTARRSAASSTSVDGLGVRQVGSSTAAASTVSPPAARQPSPAAAHANGHSPRMRLLSREARSSPGNSDLRRRESSDSHARRIVANFPNPPPLPQPYPFYTKCFCEENAYILTAHLQRICQRRNLETLSHDASEAGPWRWDVDVVFVSNADKTVALWEQRASEMPETDHIVIWDYHVFVVVTCSPTTQVVARQRAKAAAMQPNARSSASAAASRNGPSRIRQSARRREGTLSGDEQPYAAVGAMHDDVSANANDNTLTGSSSWVYDLDTYLSVPTSLSKYLRRTFKADRGESVAAQFRPLFRVVSARDYLAQFASDRSHMHVSRTSEDIETEEALRASVGYLDAAPPPQWASPPPSWPLIRGPLSDTSNKLMDAFVDVTGRRVVSDDGRHGFVVTLAELKLGMGLGGDARVRSRAGSDNAAQLDEQQHVDARVSRMIDMFELRLSNDHSALATSDDGEAAVGYQSRRSSQASSSSTSSSGPRRRASTNNAKRDGSVDEDGNETGFVVGGVQRIYGVRPPPPVPHGEDRFAQLHFHGRGKRVSSNLFPAYMHATLQSRAAKPGHRGGDEVHSNTADAATSAPTLRQAAR